MLMKRAIIITLNLIVAIGVVVHHDNGIQMQKVDIHDACTPSEICSIHIGFARDID